jgi:hypothetical protein
MGPYQGVFMNKLLLTIVLGMLTLNVLACGGSKDEEEKKRAQEIVSVKH